MPLEALLPSRRTPCPATRSCCLKADHKTVKGLFREFERAGDDPGLKKQVVNQIIEELTVHTYLENTIIYPAVRAALPDLESDVMESYEEHHVADVLCLELLDLAPEQRALRREDHRPHRERPAPHR